MGGIPSSDIVDAIYRLLPGFITAWIFYGLTAHPKSSSFERVIQALIFTLLVEAMAQCVGFTLIGIGTILPFAIVGEWNDSNSFIWKVLIAIAFGFVLAWFANNNRFHNCMPDSLTKRTSYPSEWFSAFNRTKRRVYLQLQGNRRIFGWPEEWPDEPGKGHFVLTEAEWILPDNTRVPLPAIERMLVPAAEVELVEFEKELNEVLSAAGEIEASANVMIEHNQTDDDASREGEGEQDERTE